jgi:hypothetical protein
MKSVSYLAVIFASLLAVGTGESAIRTWDGGGADANWNTPANWVGDVAPAAGDDLVFPAAAAQFATNNNFIILTSFNSIVFEGGSYTVAGNPFRLVAGMIVNGGTQAINTAVTLSAPQTFNSSAGGTATLAVLSLGANALNLSGGGSYGIGIISGSGQVTKQGNGASLIASASGFSGSFLVVGGILVIDANVPNSMVVTDGDTGAVGGTGTIGNAMIVRGAISAGTLTSPTGILNTGNLSFQPNGNFVPKLGGITPGSTGHDQLNVTGTVNLSNARLAPLAWNGFRPAISDAFVIIRNDGADPVNGTFLNAPEGAVFGGPLNTAFRVSYVGGDGNDVAITRVSRAQFDFDGDGKSDVSTFRPATGTWSELLSGSGTTATQQFGLATDRIAPADFDGDNRTDVAVFRPSNGVWYRLLSATSTVRIDGFGLNGDIPVPNDFDGDGRADLAVYRPSDGVWYQLRSLGNQFYAQQFGISTDKPLMGDFDGDGIGDIAVYRPSEGGWYIFRSSDNGFYAYPFGIATDVPCPADVDGDGKTDSVVFRATADPAQPDFYILRSSDLGYQGAQWGVPGDVPAMADYDGDGKADIGVYRPSNRDWYWLRTSDVGLGFLNFGQSGDLAVPAAFTQ